MEFYGTLFLDQHFSKVILRSANNFGGGRGLLCCRNSQKRSDSIACSTAFSSLSSLLA